MRYFALATDYDGTLARAGRVDSATLDALKQVADSGRKLVLVSGRELDDLQQVFPEHDIFDLIVAENGALLFEPRTRLEATLASTVSDDFVAALKRKGVEPLSRGRVIVATREPNETAVLQTIRELGLELQVIFNKGAVMVLPSGVNKATGLNAALKRLQLSPHNVAGIGDAENDHAFLSLCELSAAVANALPQVKETCDYVSRRDHGAGVRDLARRLLKDDLASLGRRLRRNDLVLGRARRGRQVRLPAYCEPVLFAGSSGGGKSSLAKAMLERLDDFGYQFCVVDPEGDYEDFEAGVVLGSRAGTPAADEVLQVLADPAQNVVLNLLGVPLAERPAFFTRLLTDLLELRAKTGRPHWIIIDEAHHVLPHANQAATAAIPGRLDNVAFVTVEPGSMQTEALAMVRTAFAVGEAPEETIAAFAREVEEPVPPMPAGEGGALVWPRGGRPQRFTVAESRYLHRRHKRKYAEGDVGPEQAFYFRGPEGKLNLKAQNLFVFLQTAEGIDDQTWTFHLRRGDYSRWLREVIKDEDLADEVANLESRSRLPPRASRARVRDAIESRYTLPASA